MLSKQVEIRGSILDRYRTRSPDLTKESRSIDRAENHGAERKESRHESRAEINSFEDEDPKPVPNHLPDQPRIRISCVSFVEYGRTRIFSKSIVSSQRTGNEVLILF